MTMHVHVQHTREVITLKTYTNISMTTFEKKLSQNVHFYYHSFANLLKNAGSTMITHSSYWLTGTHV